MGDQAHPQTNEIYAKLGELKKMIKEAGYVPDTSYALQDTYEGQKEHNLWNHSERLALSFGLLNTPDGSSTIRVFKNLRICGDCHSFYRFVNYQSKSYIEGSLPVPPFLVVANVLVLTTGTGKNRYFRAQAGSFNRNSK
ncbi:hypothetical protein CRYUN_Cryun33cG0005500 [Craigia yunnanensis]